METTTFQDPCKCGRRCLAGIYAGEHLSSCSQQSLEPAVRWGRSVLYPERRVSLQTVSLLLYQIRPPVPSLGLVIYSSQT